MSFANREACVGRKWRAGMSEAHSLPANPLLEWREWKQVPQSLLLHLPRYSNSASFSVHSTCGLFLLKCKLTAKRQEARPGHDPLSPLPWEQRAVNTRAAEWPRLLNQHGISALIKSIFASSSCLVDSDRNPTLTSAPSQVRAAHCSLFF